MIPDDVVRYVKEKMPDEKKVHDAIEAFNLGYAVGYAEGHADGRREGLDDNPDRWSSEIPKRKRKVKT